MGKIYKYKDLETAIYTDHLIPSDLDLLYNLIDKKN